MSSPSICIVIPTRERVGTLLHTLRTCIDQDYENLEILVCDNHSQDGTSEMVKSLSDSRIRYVNPMRRLSMADNWEFALQSVKTEFVTVLGDDDGFLPSAISDISELLVTHRVQVVAWKKIEYCWPNYTDPSLRHFMSIPLANQLIHVKSAEALRDIYRFWLGYSRGPCIYNSMVSMESIERIRTRDGKLFQSLCPDVYSSLAIGSVIDRYLLSTRPFSVNGASAHSNGTAYARPTLDQQAAELFMSEYSESIPTFGSIRGSISAAVMDSLVSFSSKANIATPKPNYKAAFRRIVSELKASPELLRLHEASLRALANTYHLERYLNRQINMQCHQARKTSVLSASDIQNISSDQLIIWSDRFGIGSVDGAASLATKVLGKYRSPLREHQYSLPRRLVSKLGERFVGINVGLSI